MVTSSAPGKVYLFGEHAVVYGEPAVPCAIERRARVTAEEIDEGLVVHAEDLKLDGFTVEYTGDSTDLPDVDAAKPLLEASMGYINEAVTQVRDAAGAPDAGFEIWIESDIPLGAGLGSSAAVAVVSRSAATSELAPAATSDVSCSTVPLGSLGEGSYPLQQAPHRVQSKPIDSMASARAAGSRSRARASSVSSVSMRVRATARGRSVTAASTHPR